MSSFLKKKVVNNRATLFGHLFFDQLNLANYLMQIRLDLEGLKI